MQGCCIRHMSQARFAGMLWPLALSFIALGSATSPFIAHQLHE